MKGFKGTTRGCDLWAREEENKTAILQGVYQRHRGVSPLDAYCSSMWKTWKALSKQDRAYWAAKATAVRAAVNGNLRDYEPPQLTVEYAASTLTRWTNANSVQGSQCRDGQEGQRDSEEVVGGVGSLRVRLVGRTYGRQRLPVRHVSPAMSRFGAPWSMTDDHSDDAMKLMFGQNISAHYMHAGKYFAEDTYIADFKECVMKWREWDDSDEDTSILLGGTNKQSKAQPRSNLGPLYEMDEATGLPILPPVQLLERLESKNSHYWVALVRQFLNHHYSACTGVAYPSMLTTLQRLPRVAKSRRFLGKIS